MIEFHISKERCLMNHISYAQFVTTACRENQVWVLKGVNTVFHSNYYLLKYCHLMGKCMFPKCMILD